MPLLVVATRQAGLVATRQCDEAGLDKYGRHRLVAARRASVATRGVLDLRTELGRRGMAERDGPDRRRHRAAYLALLAHGPHAFAVGQCALALLGAQGLPLRIRPEVGLPRAAARSPRDGIVVRRFAGPVPTVVMGGFLVAAPVWALAQGIRDLDRDRAVAVLDSAVQRRLILPDEVRDVADLVRDMHGGRHVRAWCALVDGRSQSPLETRARLQCIDAGIPPDDLQVPIRDARGRVVARGDLGWHLQDDRWLIAEIDGAGPHGTPEALFLDRERQNAVVVTGRVDMLRFTAEDIARTVLPVAVRAHLAQDDLRSLRRSAV